MFDLIDNYYQCENVSCKECTHCYICDMAWEYGLISVESHFYSIHYAEGEV